MPLDKLNTQNFAEATLAQGVDARSEIFMIENARNLPDAPFRMVINREVVEVKRKSGNKLLNIQRGIENTKANSHQAGDKLQVTWTNEMLGNLNQQTHLNQNLINEIHDHTTTNQFLHARGVSRHELKHQELCRSSLNP